MSNICKINYLIPTVSINALNDFKFKILLRCHTNISLRRGAAVSQMHAWGGGGGGGRQGKLKPRDIMIDRRGAFQCYCRLINCSLVIIPLLSDQLPIIIPNRTILVRCGGNSREFYRTMFRISAGGKRFKSLKRTQNGHD